MWSPDLDPPSTGIPDNLASFELLMQVCLGELGSPGSEVFGFTVCSPDKLALAESGQFFSHILVLDTFSWDTVLSRVKKLLLHTESCRTWNDVIGVLSGCLAYSDG